MRWIHFFIQIFLCTSVLYLSYCTNYSSSVWKYFFLHAVMKKIQIVHIICLCASKSLSVATAICFSIIFSNQNKRGNLPIKTAQNFFSFPMFLHVNSHRYLFCSLHLLYATVFPQFCFLTFSSISIKQALRSTHFLIRFDINICVFLRPLLMEKTLVF